MVWAYLIVSTCQIVLYSPADDLVDDGKPLSLMPRPFAVVEFRDRELCDYLVSQGISTIYVDKRTPPEDVPDFTNVVGEDLNITK